MARRRTIDVNVDVQVASAVDSVPGAAFVRDWVLAACQAAPAGDACEVSVRIVDEAEGQALNSTYRGAQKATNVLSFPAAGAEPAHVPPGVRRPLGDIVICGPVVEREALAHGKAPADHWAHLLVHGALHLLGYDHEHDDDATVMEAEEKRILAGRGVADPYSA